MWEHPVMDRPESQSGRLLWHPHQKLWNWRLQTMLRRIGRPLGLGRALVRVLIAVDSALLLARVVVRRVVVLGPVGALRTTPPSSRSVLYVDCGVHKRGEQIRYMHEWFATRCDLRIIGFEASANHASDARDALADVPDVELRQLALVGPGNDASEVK